MKRILLLLLAAALAVSAFVLAACDDDKKTETGTNNEQTGGEQTGGESQSGGPLTEEEWQAAFGEGIFADISYTMTHGSRGEAPYSYTITVRRQTLQDGTLLVYSNNGDTEDLNETVYYEIDADAEYVYRWNADGGWVKSSGRYEPDMAPSLVPRFGAVHAAFARQSDGSYAADAVEISVSGTAMALRSAKARFDGTDLVYLYGETAEGMFFEFTLSGHGTTAVELPADYTDQTGGGQGGEEEPSLTEEEWEAAFSDEAFENFCATMTNRATNGQSEDTTAEFAVTTKPDGCYLVYVKTYTGEVLNKEEYLDYHGDGSIDLYLRAAGEDGFTVDKKQTGDDYMTILLTELRLPADAYGQLEYTGDGRYEAEQYTFVLGKEQYTCTDVSVQFTDKKMTAFSFLSEHLGDISFALSYGTASVTLPDDATPAGTVTEEQWLAAFAPEAFENYTVFLTQKMTDGDGAALGSTEMTGRVDGFSLPDESTGHSATGILWRTRYENGADVVEVFDATNGCSYQTRGGEWYLNKDAAAGNVVAEYYGYVYVFGNASVFEQCALDQTRGGYAADELTVTEGSDSMTVYGFFVSFRDGKIDELEFTIRQLSAGGSSGPQESGSEPAANANEGGAVYNVTVSLSFSAYGTTVAAAPSDVRYVSAAVRGDAFFTGADFAEFSDACLSAFAVSATENGTESAEVYVQPNGGIGLARVETDGSVQYFEYKDGEGYTYTLLNGTWQRTEGAGDIPNRAESLREQLRTALNDIYNAFQKGTLYYDTQNGNYVCEGLTVSFAEGLPVSVTAEQDGAVYAYGQLGKASVTLPTEGGASGNVPQTEEEWQAAFDADIKNSFTLRSTMRMPGMTDAVTMFFVKGQCKNGEMLSYTVDKEGPDDPNPREHYYLKREDGSCVVYSYEDGVLTADEGFTFAEPTGFSYLNDMLLLKDHFGDFTQKDGCAWAAEFTFPAGSSFGEEAMTVYDLTLSFGEDGRIASLSMDIEENGERYTCAYILSDVGTTAVNIPTEGSTPAA